MQSILSKAEWDIMMALWQKPNQTMSGIIALVGDKQNWKYNTFATYVKRMVDKGLLAFKHEGKDKLYYAAVGEQQCIKSESKEMTRKIDGRYAKDFLAYMIRDSKLNAQDTAELMELLESLSQEGA